MRHNMESLVKFLIFSTTRQYYYCKKIFIHIYVGEWDREEGGTKGRKKQSYVGRKKDEQGK